MKKIHLLIIVLILILSLVSCGHMGTYKISFSDDIIGNSDTPALIGYYILYNFDINDNGTSCIHVCEYADNDTAQAIYEEALSSYVASDVAIDGNTVTITYTKDIYSYVEMLEFYSSFSTIERQ